MKKVILLLFFSGLVLAQGFLLHDPTKPLGYKGQNDLSVTDLKLSMTFLSDSNKIAIINGESYHIGDFIGGGKIIEITASKVVIQAAGDNSKIEISSGTNIKRNNVSS